MNTADELAEKFRDKYSTGQIQEALQIILNHPENLYDSYASPDHFLWYIVNFCDSSCFQCMGSTLQTIRTLTLLLKSNPALTTHCQDLFTLLNYEKALISCYFAKGPLPLQKKEFLLIDLLTQLKNNHSPEPDVIEEALAWVPTTYRAPFRLHLQMVMRGLELLQKKNLSYLFNPNNFISRIPWHSFNYPIPLTIKEEDILEKEAIPCLFLQPLQTDYCEFLNRYTNQPALLICETVPHLLQMVKYEAVFRALLNPHHGIYVLSEPPSIQWQAQPHILDFFQKKSFRSIFVADFPSFNQQAIQLEKVLQDYFSQPVQDLTNDTAMANRLYQLGQRLTFNEQALKYGQSRFLALINKSQDIKWRDSHRGQADQSIDLLLPLVDYLPAMLQANRKPRLNKYRKSSSKIKLAHVVSQLVDDRHAPTKLIKLLTTHYDPQQFELFVIVTERFAVHPLDYPFTPYFSPSSLGRGKRTLKELEERHVQTWVQEQPLTYQKTATKVAEKLQEWEIEAAVFHGPDLIHTSCANQLDIPLKVLFEHGTPPSYPVFDLAIMSTEDAIKQQKELLQKLHIEPEVLVFCVDSRDQWQEIPYPKEKLGIPPNSFVMTTISNHLDNRLGSDMCKVIAKILQRCPQAHYAPMGEVHNKQSFEAFFEAQGVKERVHFLGSVPNPSQYARSMELYLNEFPFGSGLAILDAMAAGCPVVSMYDEKGPPQARYGATFFGYDRVIQSGEPEDYIKLACQLIQNPAMYQEWSSHAKQQYEKRGDVKTYVRNFESLIKEYMPTQK